MNKKDLVQSLVKKFTLTNTKANEIVSHTLDSISASLLKGKPVTFIGFGTFTVKKRAARKGRNPQTGEVIKIAARKVIRFAAGKKLKDTVNKK